MHVSPTPETYYLYQAYMHAWDHDYECNKYNEISAETVEIQLVAAEEGQYIGVLEKPPQAREAKALKIEDSFFAAFQQLTPEVNKKRAPIPPEGSSNGRIVQSMPLPGVEDHMVCCFLSSPKDFKDQESIVYSPKWQGKDTSSMFAWFGCSSKSYGHKATLESIEDVQRLE